MCPVQSATSNTTIGVLAARLTTEESDYWKSLLRDILRGVWQGISAVWRALRIGDFLLFILSILLFIIKWCFFILLSIFLFILTWCIIVSAIVISIRTIWRAVYWGLPQLWKICRESRRRRLQEQRWNNEIRRHEARRAELCAKQAADAAASKADKLRKAQEEQALKDELRRQEAKRQAKLKADYKRWKMECDIAFRDKPSMTKFPFPPLPRCTHLNCFAFAKVPTPACPHNVKQFLKGSGVFSMRFLRLERYRWHPDRFSTCREDLKPEFQRLAVSLSKLLNSWYKELEEQQRRGDH
ncbi:hypothetical protein V492_02406 [Pseudogymnoascus sp. VKM F-4246]|nr:hypothetical protein V492_02406 [Pseudogymnoascus sp. VKM F-4246]